jgi:hypothetical protein
MNGRSTSRPGGRSHNCFQVTRGTAAIGDSGEHHSARHHLRRGEIDDGLGVRADRFGVELGLPDLPQHRQRGGKIVAPLGRKLDAAGLGPPFLVNRSLQRALIAAAVDHGLNSAAYRAARDGFVSALFGREAVAPGER